MTVQLEHTEDGGRLVEGTNDLFSAVYLSLFGGNVADSGRQGDTKTWWANQFLDPIKHRRSRTQYILLHSPAFTPKVIQAVKQAVSDDCSWIPGVKVTNVEIFQLSQKYVDFTIEIDGSTSFNFRGEII